MSLARKVAILISAAFALQAAPTLTTVQDSIFKADGTNFNGIAVISWMQFESTDNSKIGLQSLTVGIVNGAFYVQLVPNSGIVPPSYYTVQYSSNGMQQFTETWSVPPSTTPLKIAAVLVASNGTAINGGSIVQQPSTTTIVPEANVTGLLTDLALRPIKGAAFGTSRAAMVDDTGAIGTVDGNLPDCVRVDGTSGVCYDATQAPSFSDSEIPGGTINGTNATFTLANTAAPTASISLYRNGLLQQAGVDYNIQPTGSILFAAVSVPQPTDALLASYRMAGAASSGLATSVGALTGFQTSSTQVLCSASGTSTTTTTNVSLGSCVIPANTLATGDRVEVRFTLAHQGTSNGFAFAVLWGQTTMVQRTASAFDGVVTGTGDASPGAGGTALDIQTWGTVLPLASGVAMATDPRSANITVNFTAAMSAAGTDNVSLQNYTVLRYPAN